MRGVNHCEFIGRIAADPEIKTMPNGAALTEFRIGVATGKGDDTMWVTCVAFGDAAKEIAQGATSGQQIYVNGRVQLRTWIGVDRQQRSQLNLKVNDFLLGEQDWESLSADSSPATEPQ